MYTLRTKLSEVFVRKVTPIILIAVGVCMNYNSITDYILKDYKTTSGVVTEINHSREYDNIYINGKNYYFNIGLFQNIKIGSIYNFTYTKEPT